MLIQNFRTAAKGLGKYCTIKIELLVRKGGKAYRITCGESELRFTASGCSDAVFPFAPDATVREFSRAIAWLTDSRNDMGFGMKSTEP